MKSGAGSGGIQPERPGCPISALKGFGDEDRRLQGADDIPGFNTDSFWNYRATCELSGARYPAAPLGLTDSSAISR
jgi:hypothetical protein